MGRQGLIAKIEPMSQRYPWTAIGPDLIPCTNREHLLTIDEKGSRWYRVQIGERRVQSSPAWRGKEKRESSTYPVLSSPAIDQWPWGFIRLIVLIMRSVVVISSIGRGFERFVYLTDFPMHDLIERVYCDLIKLFSCPWWNPESTSTNRGTYCQCCEESYYQSNQTSYPLHCELAENTKTIGGRLRTAFSN